SNAGRRLCASVHAFDCPVWVRRSAGRIDCRQYFVAVGKAGDRNKALSAAFLFSGLFLPP
ncbi:MAG: hypothetical protein ACXVZM_13855, partial [Terriglobales bacterium]